MKKLTSILFLILFSGLIKTEEGSSVEQMLKQIISNQERNSQESKDLKNEINTVSQQLENIKSDMHSLQDKLRADNTRTPWEADNDPEVESLRRKYNNLDNKLYKLQKTEAQRNKMSALNEALNASEKHNLKPQLQDSKNSFTTFRDEKYKNTTVDGFPNLGAKMNRLRRK